MMRRYRFIEGHPSSISGWTFSADRGDGNGPCMWPSNMLEGDAYPEYMVLCREASPGCWSVVSLGSTEARRVEVEALFDTGKPFNIKLYQTAKKMVKEKPMALAGMVEDLNPDPVPVRGDPPTLSLPWCVAGDDPTASADEAADDPEED